MTEFKLIEVENEKDFNPVSICADAPITQSFFYGEWHKVIGHKVRRFKIEQGSGIVAFFQILKFPLPFGKSLLYIPYGPVLKESITKNLALFLKSAFAQLLIQESAVFLRMDFYPFENVKNQRPILNEHFVKAPPYTYYSAGLQPRAEWMLGLNKNEEDLFRQMHSSTRQSIRSAGRKGVKVKIVSGEQVKPYFKPFFELLKEAAQRGSFTLQKRDYYEAAFRICQEKEMGFLSLGMAGNKILVADLVLFFGQRANWVFSGTTREHKEKRATYLSLWKSILEAKKRGALWFNFGAVASGDVHYKNWQGFSDFKKRFGGVKIEHTPFYDVVSQPLPYFLYKIKKRVDCL